MNPWPGEPEPGPDLQPTGRFWHGERVAPEAVFPGLTGPGSRGRFTLGEIVCPECEAVVARVVLFGDRTGPIIEAREHRPEGMVTRWRGIDGPIQGRWGEPDEMDDRTTILCRRGHEVDLTLDAVRRLIATGRQRRRRRGPGRA